MKRARRSFESLAALAKAGRARETGSRRHSFRAVLGRDNRPGGRRPRGTIGDATAPHAPDGAVRYLHAVNGAASTGHGVATAEGLAL